MEARLETSVESHSRDNFVIFKRIKHVIDSHMTSHSMAYLFQQLYEKINKQHNLKPKQVYVWFFNVSEH